MTRTADSIKIKSSKAKNAWLNKKAQTKYNVAYDYLTPKQKRMIMQDLPRKLLEETKKNPYKGTGMGTHTYIPKA